MYKDALRDIRAGSKAPSSWFQTPWMYPGIEISTAVVQPVKVATKPVEVSEKDNVLESFTEFSSDKLELKESFKFDGGEIKRKANLAHQEIIESSGSLEELTSRIQKQIPRELFESRFKTKSLSPACKVVFVTDEYNHHPESTSELTTFFSLEVASLFERMIGAMGLSETDYYVTAMNIPEVSESNSRDILLDEIFLLRPRFVISLGAIATNGLLGDNQRLKSVHGKLFDFTITNQESNSVEFKVMPLFSPKLLHTAPNMKKTAWKDMQMIMELL